MPNVFIDETVPTSGTSWITGKTLGTARSNGGGYWNGPRFQVGASPITITHVGRYKAAGDSGTHSIKLFASDRITVLASTSVNMSSAADADGFVYVPLSYTLSASTIYCLGSQETTGVDTFYDVNDTTITTTAVASCLNGFYTNGSTNGTGGTSGNSYGPVNFKY